MKHSHLDPTEPELLQEFDAGNFISSSTKNDDLMYYKKYAAQTLNLIPILNKNASLPLIPVKTGIHACCGSLPPQG